MLALHHVHPSPVNTIHKFNVLVNSNLQRRASFIPSDQSANAVSITRHGSALIHTHATTLPSFLASSPSRTLTAFSLSTHNGILHTINPSPLPYHTHHLRPSPTRLHMRLPNTTQRLSHLHPQHKRPSIFLRSGRESLQCLSKPQIQPRQQLQCSTHRIGFIPLCGSDFLIRKFAVIHPPRAKLPPYLYRRGDIVHLDANGTIDTTNTTAMTSDNFCPRLLCRLYRGRGLHFRPQHQRPHLHI